MRLQKCQPGVDTAKLQQGPDERHCHEVVPMYAEPENDIQQLER